jgi:hypothetical protein
MNITEVLPIWVAWAVAYLPFGYKKSLKIPKGNQNPYTEEEQTT